MSAVQRFTYTTTGAKDVVNLDHLQVPFGASVLINLTSGTATFSLQYMMDDVSGASSGFNWVTFSTVNGLSATTLFPITQAVTAVRLNISAITGTIAFTVIQGPGSR